MKRNHCYNEIGKRCVIKTQSQEVFKKYTCIFAINNNSNEKSADITGEKLRITSKGFIGIGTTNPTTNLHINSNEVRIKLTNNNSNGLLLGKSNNSFIIKSK